MNASEMSPPEMTTPKMTTPEMTLRGMTWDHPRGLDCLTASNQLLLDKCGVGVSWQARSLLAFGDQHISEFFQGNDLMVIDHPHVPDAVAAGAVIAFDEIVSDSELALLRRTSVGASHDSYNYRGKQWALALDTAAQVNAYRADKVDGAPIFWSDVLEVAKTGRLLWPHKAVDAFSTFATLMAQKGKPLAANNIYIDEEMAAEVIDFMIELAAHVPQLCATSNPIDAAELLANSDDFDIAICLYGYSNYSRIGFRKNLITYDDVSSFDGRASGSQLGGAGIAISSASKNVTKSAQVAMLLSLPHIQSTSYVAGGGQPGNLAAWKSESANFLTSNFFRNTLRTLERAWVRPRVLGWPDVQFHSSQLIHQALVERKSTPALISEISATYQKYIQE
ncbi:MAG: sugar ABC transporter substrate-binding protein [Actinomycetes bacterium]